MGVSKEGVVKITRHPKFSEHIPGRLQSHVYVSLSFGAIWFVWWRRALEINQWVTASWESYSWGGGASEHTFINLLIVSVPSESRQSPRICLSNEKHRSTWALPTGSTRSICRMCTVWYWWINWLSCPPFQTSYPREAMCHLCCWIVVPVVAKQCSRLHLQLHVVQPATSSREWFYQSLGFQGPGTLLILSLTTPCMPII